MKTSRAFFTRLPLLLFCVSLLSLTSISLVVSAEAGLFLPVEPA